MEGEGNTGGLDDAVLVGFGGVAVPLPVREALHHLRSPSPPRRRRRPRKSYCSREELGFSWFRC